MRRTRILQRRLRRFFALLALAQGGLNWGYSVEFEVTFDDPSRILTAFRNRIESHALAAGGDWGELLDSDAKIEIVVRPSGSIPRATGRSVTSAFVRTENGLDIFEQGAAAEIRTGADVNGETPDIELTFNINYLRNELWFDPDPESRTTPVNSNRTDAMSVFLHELGHAFAYNGWRDGETGELGGSFASTFDVLIEKEREDWYIKGASSLSVWGEPIAITHGNPSHFGNHAPDPGASLVPGLMNGVVFLRGTRYWITGLDLAILEDVGLPVSRPVERAPAEMDFVIRNRRGSLEMPTRTDRVYRVDTTVDLGLEFEFFESFFGDGSSRILDLGPISSPAFFLRGAASR